MRKVQQEIHPDHAGIGIRQKELQMPQVQKHKSQTADHLVSGDHVQKELSSNGMSTLSKGNRWQEV
jgi:hypothetical protein